MSLRRLLDTLCPPPYRVKYTIYLDVQSKNIRSIFGIYVKDLLHGSMNQTVGVMSQQVESNVLEKTIRDLKKEREHTESLLYLYKMSRRETRQMEIRYLEEQAKVLTYLCEIVTLKDELRNIKILYESYRS